MIGKSLFYERHHIARDRIRFEALARWRLMIFRQGLTVLGVEIPRPAHRIVAFHQEAGLLTHLAIEIFHAQLLAPVGPARKFIERGDKTIILTNGERDW